jgi:NADH-quinone oxidoreductase subunit J
MSVMFYGSAIIAILSTLMVITRTNVVHALLYFIVSLFSIAVIFYVLGAPFAAMLEIIVYAGAIMVMFLFVIMMLNMGSSSVNQEKDWMNPGTWVGPVILTVPLLAEMIYAINLTHAEMAHTVVSAKDIGIDLFGPYVLAVELASMLLLAGLVGAYHLARK